MKLSVTRMVFPHSTGITGLCEKYSPIHTTEELDECFLINPILWHKNLCYEFIILIIWKWSIWQADDQIGGKQRD